MYFYNLFYHKVPWQTYNNAWKYIYLYKLKNKPIQIDPKYKFKSYYIILYLFIFNSI
jgi:hypothetical protein